MYHTFNLPVMRATQLSKTQPHPGFTFTARSDLHLLILEAYGRNRPAFFTTSASPTGFQIFVSRGKHGSSRITVPNMA